MKNLPYIFILLISFAAQAKDNELYSAFKQYSDITKHAETVLPLIPFYSEKQYQSFELYFKHENLKEGIDTLFSRLQFPSVLHNEKSHNEIINKDSGCLVVSGLSQEKKRVSVYLGFVRSYKWLIDYINIEYINDSDDYLNTPICDNEALMKKRMENWQ